LCQAPLKAVFIVVDMHLSKQSKGAGLEHGKSRPDCLLAQGNREPDLAVAGVFGQ
jgi:hypothetical protein